MWERGEAECSRQGKGTRKILHADMLQRLEGRLYKGRWVRRRPERMGREGMGWPRSHFTGTFCFVKTALMLSGEDLWRTREELRDHADLYEVGQSGKKETDKSQV